MDINILSAAMEHTEEEGYRGTVKLELEGHRRPYEVTLLSKKGKTWDYSLNFAGEPGPEEQIAEAEAALEEDDDLFDRIIDAAMNRLQ